MGLALYSVLQAATFIFAMVFHQMVLYLGLIRRKRAYWLALIPLALFSATNLLGPVCCIRYVIPLYMTLPIEIASLFVDTKRA